MNYFTILLLFLEFWGERDLTHTNWGIWWQKFAEIWNFETQNPKNHEKTKFQVPKLQSEIWPQSVYGISSSETCFKIFLEQPYPRRNLIHVETCMISQNYPILLFIDPFWEHRVLTFTWNGQWKDSMNVTKKFHLSDLFFHPHYQSDYLWFTTIGFLSPVICKIVGYQE